MPQQRARGSRPVVTQPYREHPLRIVIPLLARATTALIAVAAASSARAASPVPQPPVDLGETSFFDGEAGPGGLFETIGNGYVAPYFTNASGQRVTGANRQWIGSVTFHPAYVSDLPFAGGTLGAEALIPVTALHLEVSGTRPATAGGVGDVTLAPFIQWLKMPLWQQQLLSMRLAIHVSAPTGHYSANDLINPGSGVWQVSPYFAFTWRLSDRWEISGRSIYDWSSRSGAPPVSLGASSSQAGDQFAQNLSASVAITKQWRIGAGGYGLWQLSDTRVNDRAVAGSREQSIGIGPGLLWSDGHATIIANLYEEVAVHNRPQGTSAALRLLLPF